MTEVIGEGRCFIGGNWVPAEQTFPVMDPATGRRVGRAADGDPSLAKAAIDAASKAFSSWARTPASERGAALRRVAASLREDIDRIASVVVAEQGKPKSQAVFEVGYAIEWLEWYAEEARRTYGEVIPPPVAEKRMLVLRQPVGVAVAITPWNFPVAMIARKLAPALGAGCTIVVKPAEQTPLSAVVFFEALERAELPRGVANLVTASDPEPISATLLEDERVRKITFTGSTEVGKLLVRASAHHLARVSLELGGQAPFIVFEDADLEQATAGVLASKFQVSGQSCLCANRIYVQSSVVEEFTSRLRGAVGGLKVGHGADADTDVGPLIDDRVYEKVRRHVEDARQQGADVAIGGERLEGEGLHDGYFFAPTVLVGCEDSMLIAKEETFGPVAPLFSFEVEAEVLQRANDSPYGLAAYFYTRDLGRTVRMAEGLEYGIVGVNDPRPASPVAPFGGFKESGLGREGSREGIEAFLETKLVSLVLP